MLEVSLDKLGSSESIAVSNKAAALRAAGKNISMLSIGDTHFTPPTAIQTRMIEAVTNNKTHYTASAGIQPLRELIARMYYQGRFSPEQILLVPGVKQGLFYIFETLPEKKVAAIEPAWLGYKHTAIMTGKDYISINRYQDDWLSHLQQADFKILIVCNPNNPDGYLFTEEELKKIVEIARKKNAWIVLDDIYDHFEYRQRNSSFFAGDTYEKVIACNGFSKSHAMTGLRLGFLAIKDPDVRSTCLRIQEHLATCPGSVAQYGALGLEESAAEVTQFREYYRQNREEVSRLVPQWSSFSPDGGFYFFVDTANFGYNNGADFAAKLLDEQGVAVVPGAAYGAAFESYIRISFSTDREQLVTGVSKLKQFLENPHGK